jgi:hypothetical protein
MPADGYPIQGRSGYRPDRPNLATFMRIVDTDGETIALFAPLTTKRKSDPAKGPGFAGCDEYVRRSAG